MFYPVGVALATAVIASAAAAAAAAGPLEVVSRVSAEQRVLGPDGSTRLVQAAAKKVVPGDRVIFTLAYRNAGAKPLGDLVFDNPVPRGIAYRGPAADSPAPELSVDGRTYGALAGLQVQTPAGVRAATADDVTHVRWKLATPLAAGARGQLSFRAVLK